MLKKLAKSFHNRSFFMKSMQLKGIRMATLIKAFENVCY
jgi:hypothetical protein